jgi:hypothetical protein
VSPQGSARTSKHEYRVPTSSTLEHSVSRCGSGTFRRAAFYRGSASLKIVAHEPCAAPYRRCGAFWGGRHMRLGNKFSIGRSLRFKIANLHRPSAPAKPDKCRRARAISPITRNEARWINCAPIANYPCQSSIQPAQRFGKNGSERWD